MTSEALARAMQSVDDTGLDRTVERTPTALLTGSTDGIGAAAAVELGARGWEVYVHGRDRRRGESVAARVREAGGTANFLRADLASPAAVRDLAATVRDRTDRLDALVLNAALAREECRLAWDGVEETFAVNQLAPYLLAHELADLLRASAPARVVVTSSAVHSRGDLDLKEGIDCTGDYDTLDAYARSKLANLLFTVELADRFEDAGVSVNAFHPGFVPGSGLYRHVGPLFRVVVAVARTLPFVATSVAEGAEGIVHLSDSTAVEDVTGAYFHGTERTEPDPRVGDLELRARLWSTCATLAGVDSDWP